MSGYLDSRKLTNVKGRLNYITDKDKQEGTKKPKQEVNVAKLES